MHAWDYRYADDIPEEAYGPPAPVTVIYDLPNPYEKYERRGRQYIAQHPSEQVFGVDAKKADPVRVDGTQASDVRRPVLPPWPAALAVDTRSAPRVVLDSIKATHAAADDPMVVDTLDAAVEVKSLPVAAAPVPARVDKTARAVPPAPLAPAVPTLVCAWAERYGQGMCDGPLTTHARTRGPALTTCSTHTCSERRDKCSIVVRKPPGKNTKCVTCGRSPQSLAKRQAFALEYYHQHKAPGDGNM